MLRYAVRRERLLATIDSACAVLIALGLSIGAILFLAHGPASRTFGRSATVLYFMNSYASVSKMFTTVGSHRWLAISKIWLFPGYCFVPTDRHERRHWLGRALLHLSIAFVVFFAESTNGVRIEVAPHITVNGRKGLGRD
jgi:hypothetical protein